ncbi:MAG: LysR family transcriptional regulator [Pseudomonadota bacterium]
MTDTNFPKLKDKKRIEAHALLYEMIRSFATLARTLNLSHAVKELGCTRQTLRRHISLLEELKGVALFEVKDRQYRLTEEGTSALPEALDILARTSSWLMGQVSHYHGMQRAHAVLPDNSTFWLQQQPMGELWASERSLLRECFRAWAVAGGDVESEAMKHVRPFFMVYRNSINGWICVEIGDKASYVTWYGWATARSSIGRALYGLPGGDEFAHLMVEPFEDASNHQNTRLDHIHTQLRREPEGPHIPLNYRRLVLAGRFPDGSPALISVLDRCYEINIADLDESAIMSMPQDLVMPRDPVELLYEQQKREDQKDYLYASNNRNY